MKNIFKFVCLFAALTMGMVSCGGDDNNEEPTPQSGLTFTVNPQTITADGVDAATFTVKYGSSVVTNDAVITCTTTGEQVSGAKFTTTTAGTYEFVATYNSEQSAAVKVTATEKGDEPKPTEGLVLSVDKTTIEANGTDIAKLIVTQDGVVVTDDESQIRYVSYSVVETGESVARSNEFSAIANGTYTITAKYKGNECANTVTVEVVNRGAYEKYFHMVPMYDITNIECYYCTVIAEGIENVPSPYNEHLMVMGIHGPFTNNDPWLLSAAANSFQSMFGVGNVYPTVIYNLDILAPANAEEYNGVGIGKRVREQLQNNPATCGVKLESSYDSATGMAKVKVSMTATEASKYDIGCALLLDNQEPVGLFTNGVSDIVINMSGNYARMSDEAFTATVDTEVSREFEMELPSSYVELSGGIENFRVVGFVLCEKGSTDRTDGSDVRVDNAATCALGASLDYRLN